MKLKTLFSASVSAVYQDHAVTFYITVISHGLHVRYVAHRANTQTHVWVFYEEMCQDDLLQLSVVFVLQCLYVYKHKHIFYMNMPLLIIFITFR